MRILLINNTFGNFGGGSEKITYETGKILRQKQYEVFFFASDKKPYYEENYEYSSFFPKDFDKHNFFNFKNPPLLRLFYNFEAEKNLIDFITLIKPDIVHFNCFRHNLTSSVLVACKKCNIPSVITLHDSSFACPAATLITGKNNYCENLECIDGNVIPCMKYKCFNHSLIKSTVSGLEFLFTKKMNFHNIADAFICPSKFLYDMAVKAGIKEDNLFVINNFLESKYFDIEPDYSNQRYFLYVGRLVREKGLDYLLKAFKDIPEIKLRIAGEGSYRSHLEELANDLNLTNVTFLGFKKGIELENEYKNAIATILPSICSEVFGLTILEAFAYGKPVIASRIGGIPEVISHNFNGFEVTPRNAEEIKQAVLKLYYDKDLAFNMGINARRTVEEKFNSEVYFRKLNNIYNSLLKKNYNFEIIPDLEMSFSK